MDMYMYMYMYIFFPYKIVSFIFRSILLAVSTKKKEFSINKKKNKCRYHRTSRFNLKEFSCLQFEIECEFRIYSKRGFSV